MRPSTRRLPPTAVGGVVPGVEDKCENRLDGGGWGRARRRGFLAELLMAECDDRARRRSERRIKAAGFPREKSLRSVRFLTGPTGPGS